MLKANHTKWAEVIFDYYVFRLMRNTFLSIHLIGEAPKFDPRYPVLLLPNHSSWWDGFFAYLVNQKYFGKKFHIMVDEDQLEKYKFFQRLGAFSINKANPKLMIESLKYSVNILENTNTLITIFPQGELLPNFIRPLKFFSGIDRIISKYKKPINIIPTAFKIHYLKEQRAQVFFSFGDSQLVDEKTNFSTKSLSQSMESLLDNIDIEVINENFGEIILYGNSSVSHKSKSVFSKLRLGDGNDK